MIKPILSDQKYTAYRYAQPASFPYAAVRNSSETGRPERKVNNSP